MLWGFFSGIKKELLGVTRQPKTLAMIVLFPLITIVAFGTLYSNSLNQFLSIALFVDHAGIGAASASQSSQFYYRVDFLEELGKNQNFRIKNVRDESEASKLVRNNAADAGIVVTKNSPKEPYLIKVLVDNTDFVQSSVIRNAVTYQINQTTTQISTSIIHKMYQKLLSQESNTQTQLERLDAFLMEFQKTKQVTGDAERKIGSLDTNELKSLIRKQKVGLQAMKQNVQLAKNANDATLGDLTGFPANVSAALVDTGLRAKDANGNVLYRNADISFEQRMNSYWTQAQARSYLQRFYLDSISRSVDTAISEADNLEKDTGSIDEYIASFKGYVAQAKKVQEQVEVDLQQSRSLLVEVNETIKELKQYSPEFLAKPTELNFTNAVSIPNLATQFYPTVLSLVIMFTATLLSALTVIAEKKQGVITRLRTMPAHKSLLIIEKVIGMLIIMTAISMAMNLAGIAFFGITMAGDIVQASVAIAFAVGCFITLGIAIGTCTSTESSAILTILALVFPMIFVSGLLIPLEIMPSGFLVFKWINPLAATSTLLANTTIKGISLLHSAVELLMLSAISFWAMVVAYLKYF